MIFVVGGDDDDTELVPNLQKHIKRYEKAWQNVKVKFRASSVDLPTR